MLTEVIFISFLVLSLFLKYSMICDQAPADALNMHDPNGACLTYPKDPYQGIQGFTVPGAQGLPPYSALNTPAKSSMYTV